ncbi:hypothetical protein B5P45_12905 [Phyllobacterium zundukense]|uniref:Uncharacterized protein n=2 Tax=Phyllobacterium zundukense TaxID=1867719 RepID=A0A2N9VY85_9HYPH|nr:hypothetical protein BLM14_20115 [Phyllobacterium zundukense]PIO44453.1 hypothetical protein B5P45_12905 [Phyllobacterium zundukense]
MTLSGKVLHQIDTGLQGGNCTVSLRLKQEKSGEHYVVLAGIASGNYQYYPMERHEFMEFANNVAQMKALLQGTPR